MELTVLGSGGCMPIPRPLCRCRVCVEARRKGEPYRRTGPALFVHDADLLVDAPAEIAYQLNRRRIDALAYLTLTHLDPDHVEGLRVVEQIALDYRNWRACPHKRIELLLPEALMGPLERICCAHGSLIEFYERQGFVRRVGFTGWRRIGDLRLAAVPIDRGDQIAHVSVIEKGGRKVVYAPCDLKPFPEDDARLQRPDLLLVQPGLFETGLRHGFVYPADHISRSTLYTFEETLELAERIEARSVVFVHLEEYWNRSFEDYRTLEQDLPRARFAYDGMRLRV